MVSQRRHCLSYTCLSLGGLPNRGEDHLPMRLILKPFVFYHVIKRQYFFGSSEPFREKFKKYRLKFKNICGLQNPCKSKRKVFFCLTSLPVGNYRRPNWGRPLEETCHCCYDYCDNHFSGTWFLMETEPVMMLIKSFGCTCL